MLNEIKRRLAYSIWERTGWDKDENYFQAERMIDRVIFGKDSIDSIKAYISLEDYKFIEGEIKIAELPGRWY